MSHAGALGPTIGRWRVWLLRHPRLALAALTAAVLLLAGWGLTRPGAPFGPQDGTWRRVQINGDLYVGIDPSYPPFAAWTPDAIVGLEADLAREIGRRLGVQTQILIMGYDGLYDALYVGTVDLLISGLRVDPARAGWVHYTRPYFDAGQVLVSRPGAAFQHMRDLDGRSVAVEIASAGDLAARRWARRLGSLHIERFMLPADALRAVETGQTDAALVDTVSARLYLAERESLVMADRTTVAEEYVIALRKGDFRLVKEVERALDAVISDGTLDALIDRWF